MNRQKRLVQARQARRQRVRKKVLGTSERPRLSVFKSARHIYVQLIDDVRGHTLLSQSSLPRDFRERFGKGSNVAGAKLLGEILAERAREKGITQVVFDRNGYLYHGRVKAVAEGAREKGLVF